MAFLLTHTAPGKNHPILLPLFSDAGIPGMYHHAQFQTVSGIRPRSLCMVGKLSINCSFLTKYFSVPCPAYPYFPSSRAVRLPCSENSRNRRWLFPNSTQCF